MGVVPDRRFGIAHHSRPDLPQTHAEIQIHEVGRVNLLIETA